MGKKGAKFNMKEKENMENLAYKLNMQEKEYNYEDLLNMNDDNRYEIINGKLYLMSSPTTIHQEIAGELFFQLKQFFNDKKCKPFIAPLDVRISGEKENNKVKNVVQPDLMVVCDENKIDEKGICGTPDFIIEIMSPSNITHDLVIKLNLYLKYGVREYWLVSPMEKKIEILELKNGVYDVEEYKIDEEIKSRIFKDLTLSLKEIYK